LLIEVWSVDGGQHLPGLDRRSDIVIPALYISVHAGVDRRLVERLDIAGQGQRLLWAAGDRLGERDGRGRLRIRQSTTFLLALRASDEAIADHDAGKQNGGRRGR